MKTWTQKGAIAELEQLIEQVSQLQCVRRFSAEHTRWVVRTNSLLQQVFGLRSQFLKTFSHYNWSNNNAQVVSIFEMDDLDEARERHHHTAYIRQLESAKGLLLAARDVIVRDGIDAVYQGKDTPEESSAILKVLFLVERKLRTVMRSPPENEKQVQDAFETLLHGADIPHSRESDSIEYSSKTYRPDFTFPKLELALEVKLSADAHRPKVIVAEINDDILAYKTKYRNLIFIVYDLGHIRDVDRFIGSFEEHENVTVRVVKQ